eukprot:4403573-Pyramimonas_sp.AAC.1
MEKEAGRKREEEICSGRKWPGVQKTRWAVSPIGPGGPADYLRRQHIHVWMRREYPHCLHW